MSILYTEDLIKRMTALRSRILEEYADKNTWLTGLEFSIYRDTYDEIDDYLNLVEMITTLNFLGMPDKLLSDIPEEDMENEDIYYDEIIFKGTKYYYIQVPHTPYKGK